MLNRSKEQYRPACVRNPLFQTTPQARLPSRTFARSKTLKTYKVFNPVFLAIMYRHFFRRVFSTGASQETTCFRSK